MRNQRKAKGSLTVEAALILPLVLFLFAVVMQTGISLYMECSDAAVVITEEKGPETIKIFYHWKRAGEYRKDEN